MATTDYSLERGLPVSMEAERSILGAILLDNSLYDQAAEHLTADDFSLDAHRRIYSRMRDLQETGRPVDMITLVEELDRRKEVEAIGGVAYLSSLIDGVPERPSIEHYVRIVRNKALLRGLINVAQNAIAEAIEHAEEAEEVLGRAEQAIFQLSENRIGQGFMDIPSIIKGSFGSLEELLERGQEIPGSMATPGFVVSGKGNAESLNSASHGAGRTMSRKSANEKFNWKDVNRFLKERGVT